jgi:hypothetical protein
MKSVTISAPVLGERKTRQQIESLLEGVNLPVEITVTNLSARPLAITEYGIDLLSSQNTAGASKAVSIKEVSGLFRLARNAESIAELNRYGEIISVAIAGEVEEVTAAKEPEETKQPDTLKRRLQNKEGNRS